MIKVAFFDIDGTLVDFKTHRIPDSTIEALKELKRKNILIIIATGRPKSLINNISQIEDLGLIDGYITMNGAYCFVNDTVICKNVMSPNEVKAIGDYCHTHSIPSIYIKEFDCVVTDPNQLFEDVFYSGLKMRILEEIDYNNLEEVEYFQVSPFLNEEQIQGVASSIPNCVVNRWHPDFADIGAIGSTKEDGIKQIIDHFGIDLSETISFGDGGNDIGMLGYTQYSVAMGNASDGVKAHAKYITDSVDSDGIANALRHFEVI